MGWILRLWCIFAVYTFWFLSGASAQRCTTVQIPFNEEIRIGFNEVVARENLKQAIKSHADLHWRTCKEKLGKDRERYFDRRDLEQIAWIALMDAYLDWNPSLHGSLRDFSYVRIWNVLTTAVNHAELVLRAERNPVSRHDALVEGVGTTLKKWVDKFYSEDLRPFLEPEDLIQVGWTAVYTTARGLDLESKSASEVKQALVKSVSEQILKAVRRQLRQAQWEQSISDSEWLSLAESEQGRRLDWSEREKLEAAIQELGQLEQRILYWRFAEEETLEGTIRETGLGQKMVRTRLPKAIDRLRDRLGSEFCSAVFDSRPENDRSLRDLRLDQRISRPAQKP